MAYTPTTSKDFKEARYYSQYDEKDILVMEEALQLSANIDDIGERIEFVVLHLASKHILCGQAQRVIIFDAIYDEVALNV